ncbi:MAG: maltose ABC transporter periplasmic protein [Actinobacteria bacterium ADurb.Bin444]|nr:MAG: maltose ABC transporter periplasmic protein [Actinobacteria bacterium ADurb.Bin444]
MTVRDSNNVVKSWGLLTPFRWPHESRAGNFTWFMWQYGADILSNDRTKVTFDSEGAVQALELVRSWFFDHEISPPINTPQPEYPKDYVGGKVGMVIEGNWAFSNFGNPEHLSATALPLGRVKAAPSGGITRGLSANSKNPQAAWEFLKYLTGTESLITLHQFTGHLTPRRSVAQALYRKLMSPPYRVFQEQALEIGRGALQHPMYDRVLGPLNDAVIKVLENKSAAGPALQGAAKQSQTVLDDYYALQKK